jgi:hypothetical protein
MTTRCTIAMLLLLFLPASSWAQADRGASVAAGVSATNMESDTSVSFSGAFEYRVNRVVGFEIETTFVPTLKSSFTADRVPIQNASPNVSSRVTADLVGLGLTAIRSFLRRVSRIPRPGGVLHEQRPPSIPTSSTRLRSDFVAGGGSRASAESADHVYAFPVLTPAPLPPGIVPPDAARRTITEPVRSSSVDLALTTWWRRGLTQVACSCQSKGSAVVQADGETDRERGTIRCRRAVSVLEPRS